MRVFINSLTYAKLCLDLPETAPHRNDEAPAGVALTLLGKQPMCTSITGESVVSGSGMKTE